jgi:hypothetical protein
MVWQCVANRQHLRTLRISMLLESLKRIVNAKGRPWLVSRLIVAPDRHNTSSGRCISSFCIPKQTKPAQEEKKNQITIGNQSANNE